MSEKFNACGDCSNYDACAKMQWCAYFIDKKPAGAPGLNVCTSCGSRDECLNHESCKVFRPDDFTNNYPNR